MGEITINPIHNVHKKYRTMNFVNPYIFVLPVDLSTNTEIGGVAATINTPALLAAKLGIDASRITNFSIVGSDIKCKITGGYAIPVRAFQFNNTPCTYYKDTDNLVTSIDYGAFYAMDVVDRLLRTYTFKNATTVGTIGLRRSNAEYIYLDNVTSLSANSLVENSGIKLTYVPRCTSYGTSPSVNDGVFSIVPGHIIYADPSMATINAGGVEADLVAAISGGCVVRYVTNFTAPSAITDLSAGTIYNIAIQLNFTPPSSTNTIDYYECYVNGILKKTITASGQYITGLTANTNYNITLKAVDIFYNKSVVSNSLSVSTNNETLDIFTGLVSYYKLDSNSNDSYGSNNGTDTSVSYVSGKVNNAGSYNGSTSKTIIGNPANLQLSTGTVSFWVKTSSPGGSYRNLFGKQSAYGMFLLDGILGYYNWGTFGGSGFKSTGVDLRDGNWHHIVFVFESGTANNKVYLDGVLKLTSSMSIGSQSDNVGIAFYYSGQNINAQFDECSIYSTKLTQNEIDLLYNSGNGTTL